MEEQRQNEQNIKGNHSEACWPYIQATLSDHKRPKVSLVCSLTCLIDYFFPAGHLSLYDEGSKKLSEEFSHGDIVLLSPMGCKDPIKNKETTGTIVELHQFHLLIFQVFTRRYCNNDLFEDSMLSKLWRLDKFSNRITWKRMMFALEEICEKGLQVTDLFSILTCGFNKDKQRKETTQNSLLVW